MSSLNASRRPPGEAKPREEKTCFQEDGEEVLSPALPTRHKETLEMMCTGGCEGRAGHRLLYSQGIRGVTHAGFPGLSSGLCTSHWNGGRDLGAPRAGETLRSPVPSQRSWKGLTQHISGSNSFPPVKCHQKQQSPPMPMLTKTKGDPASSLMKPE